MGRLGEAHDNGGVVALLCSDESTRAASVFERLDSVPSKCVAKGAASTEPLTRLEQGGLTFPQER
jgi:hypothetical protein